MSPAMQWQRKQWLQLLEPLMWDPALNEICPA
jgi:hypothetical protein